jgi:hypothetical protein
VKKTKEMEEVVGKKDRYIREMLIESESKSLAMRLFGDKAELGLPHIRSRLAVDFDGDKPTLRVLDNSGSVAASTLADLEKEIVADTKFSAILVSSNASGGGAGAGRQPSGTGSAKIPAGKSFTELSVSEKIEYLKAKQPQ